VVVDRLTKFAHFFAIAIDYNASQVVEERYSGCMGCPKPL
jgi:hypothetical protein